MAITEVGEEGSFYAEVDKQTGFSTQTILATPLRYNGEIIGVLEYINRKGEPPFEAFTPDEMDKAALFAGALQISRAFFNHSRTSSNLTSSSVESILSLNPLKSSAAS